MAILQLLVFVGISAFAHMGTTLTQNNTTLEGDATPKMLSFALHRKKKHNQPFSFEKTQITTTPAAKTQLGENFR